MSIQIGKLEDFEEQYILMNRSADLNLEISKKASFGGDSSQ